MTGINHCTVWPHSARVDYDGGRPRELTKKEMEFNLTMAQECRRQLELLLELGKLKKLRASREQQVGELAKHGVHCYVATNSLAVEKQVVSARAVQTKSKCAALSEPGKRRQEVFLATQAVGSSKVLCPDLVGLKRPDTLHLCSRGVEAETQDTLKEY